MCFSEPNMDMTCRYLDTNGFELCGHTKNIHVELIDLKCQDLDLGYCAKLPEKVGDECKKNNPLSDPSKKVNCTEDEACTKAAVCIVIDKEKAKGLCKLEVKDMTTGLKNSTTKSFPCGKRSHRYNLVFFSSPEPKAQVSYCHSATSVRPSSSIRP